jgi:ABC-type nitrate/sulfonate/bicarbonate transport system substrate-binding protein
MTTKKDPEIKEGVRELDGILPEGMNRRKFLGGTATTIFGSMLTGCIGGGDTKTDTSEGLIFQSPWKATPNYAPIYAAQRQGYWEEAGVPNITVNAGQGSGDTAKRVGTGTQNLGHSAALAIVSGLIAGYDLTLIGAVKASSMYGVVYRKDYMDNGEDLKNKTVTANSASTQQMWDIYTSLVDAPDSTKLGFAEESTSLSLFSTGEIKAVYTTLNDAPNFLMQAPDGLKVGINPVGRYLSMCGYMMYVNGEWLSDGDNMETATAVLEGFSQAGKWCLLNPEKALEMMIDVNSALKSASKDALLGQMKAGVAGSNLNNTIKNNGFGYLDKNALSNTLEQLGSRIEGDTPSLEDVSTFEPRDNANIATFSNDEWNQVEEFAQPFADIFNEEMVFNTSNF